MVILVAQRAKAEVARTDVARTEDATTYQMWRQCQGWDIPTFSLICQCCIKL